ncbi:39S ribosomal protein L34, mitochondrial-like [Homarus americanus]|uniref:Large ribosomal subunit protein bL34m n=1 Tax=Homarus americanus TaxID=6706 RepID=A0A8J5TLU0_HOMAM|nr:39S ribosomal protein L34, mitochondrial-like [Homarus americanus]KAG7177991.1 39S ribosomal protein L34-like [Homarus americanus]
MSSLLSMLRVPSVSGVMLGSWRTLFTRPQVPHALTTTPTPVFGLTGSSSQGLLALPLPSSGVIGRTNVRNHFPRPSEKRRISRHGWKVRMSTPAGRKILMRRLLKGRHILSH